MDEARITGSWRCRQKLAASCSTSLSTPISPPLSCQPRCVVQPEQLSRRDQLRLTERQSAVKMSFITKRGLSTLIPPKVRLHTLSHTHNDIN
jgi:hypothetical protein